MSRGGRAPQDPLESRPREGQNPNAGFRCLVKRCAFSSGPLGPSPRKAAGALPMPTPTPQHSPLGGFARHPKPPPLGGRASEGRAVRAPAPPPGGGGGGEGADGSNYGSDPPPPVARGRKTGCERFPGREGRPPPRPASRRGAGRGGAGPGRRPGRGLPSPGEPAGRFPYGKPSPTFPFPAPECLQARVPTSPASAGLKAPRIFRLGQWSRLGRGEL